MSKIIDYQIIDEQSIEILERVIKERIEDGWQPHGSVGCFVLHNDVRWFQAVVKYNQMGLPKFPTDVKPATITLP